MKCPYEEMDCPYIDTAGMDKIKECKDCLYFPLTQDEVLDYEQYMKEL